MVDNLDDLDQASDFYESDEGTKEPLAVLLAAGYDPKVFHFISTELVAKLASLVVLVDEYFDFGGSLADRDEIEILLHDPVVTDWIKRVGAFAPVRKKEGRKEGDS